MNLHYAVTMCRTALGVANFYELTPLALEARVRTTL